MAMSNQDSSMEAVGSFCAAPVSNQGSPMAAVGSYDSILPFKAIGLDVVVITEENHDSLAQIMNKFARSGYAALFLE